jgi:hypothetical protein
LEGEYVLVAQTSQLTVSWQLIDPVPLAPEADLAERIKEKRLERSDLFATKLITQGEKMSTIFSQDLLKDHVYILVRLPTGEPCPIICLVTIIHAGFSGCTAKPKQILLPSLLASLLAEVFCWVLNVSNAPFPIDIGESMTVGHLKIAIKKMKENALSGIDPDTLEIWKVSRTFPVRVDDN